MTNELERVTQLAEECGAYISRDNGKIIFDEAEELLAFEQAVLAKRDEEHEAIRKANVDSVAWVDAAKYEIESLQAKLAMLREIARDAEMWYSRDTMLGKELRMQAHNALNATQADVDAFMAKKKAEWEKGVLEELAYKWLPHMKMKDHSGQTSLSQTMQNSGVDDCIRHTLSMAKERGGVI